MTYQIVKSDGNTLVNLETGLLDQTSTSITLVGKNISNYGEIQNTNLLHLLEHFSSAVSPAYPLEGQVWMDAGSNSLKYYNQDSWKPIAVVSTSTSTSCVENNLWYDAEQKQLHINSGDGFDLIGPDGVSGFDTTRMMSKSLIDTVSNAHAVIETVVNGEVLAIISTGSFTINSSNAVSGFTNVYRGITFKNGSTNNVKLFGFSQFSESSKLLQNAAGNAYISASVSATTSTIMQRDSLANSAINKLTVAELASNNGVLSGTWTVQTSLLPDTDGGATLGSSGLNWSQVYTQGLTANNAVISVATMLTANVTTATISKVNFTTLTDSSNNNITRFDTDTTLSADSDTRLGTQRAIKTYIDAAIAAEVAARQSQIDGIQTLPVGTILFSASQILPSGFLECNGQSIKKDDYFNLYTSFGGIETPYGQSGSYFTLPDLRGQFIRGWDHGKGVDTDREFGSYQEDDFKSHSHTYTRYGSTRPQTGSSTPCWYSASTQNTGNTGGRETRPKNIALYPIIKY